MLSYYFQEKQRSFTSGDFWVLPRLPRWQVTHFQFLSVFQDGGHVKFPTLGQRLNVKIPTQEKAHSVNFPWVAPPPPLTLGLNIDRCIKGTKNRTRPYLYEIPAHFTHEIKTKGYDVISVNVFPRKIMRFPCKKEA